MFKSLTAGNFNFEIEQCYVLQLKALMHVFLLLKRSNNSSGFTLPHALLKMAILLHKIAMVCNLMFMAVGDTVSCNQNLHSICLEHFLEDGRNYKELRAFGIPYIFL